MSAIWNAVLAKLICSILLELGYPPLIYGLSGSAQEKTTQSFNIKFIHEVFSDRTYQNDGSLTPRTIKGALIEEEDDCLNQVLEMVKSNTVLSINGQKISIIADTLCIHGDGSHALQFTRSVRSMLDREGISVQAP
jgi:5-oxoprolinase (ATP-hydrolysing) subunit A